jgi:acetolactate synthase-1/2/3 large subunit
VTREPGVCALTAGPGVTNGMSAMASAQPEPLADGGARRPRAGDALGAGLAAGDRPRAVRAAADQAGGHAESTARSRALVDEAFAARARRTGAGVLDFPLDYVFMEAAEPERRAARRGALARA